MAKTRTILAQDDFNRADNVDIGANWDSGYTGDSNLQIVGNRLRSTSTTIDSAETYNAVTFSNDQWGQFTINTLGANTRPRILLRWTGPPNENGYAFVGGTGANNTRIEKFVNGTQTTIKTLAGVTWVGGDVLRGEVVGPVLELYRNDVLLIQAGDNEFRSGRVGIIIFTDVIADCEVDDWVAGDILPVRRMGLHYHPANYEPDDGDFHSELKGNNWFRTASGLLVPCGA